VQLLVLLGSLQHLQFSEQQNHAMMKHIFPKIFTNYTNIHHIL